MSRLKCSKNREGSAGAASRAFSPTSMAPPLATKTHDGRRRAPERPSRTRTNSAPRAKARRLLVVPRSIPTAGRGMGAKVYPPNIDRHPRRSSKSPAATTEPEAFRAESNGPRLRADRRPEQAHHQEAARRGRRGAREAREAAQGQEGEEEAPPRGRARPEEVPRRGPGRERREGAQLPAAPDRGQALRAARAQE